MNVPRTLLVVLTLLAGTACTGSDGTADRAPTAPPPTRRASEDAVAVDPPERVVPERPAPRRRNLGPLPVPLTEAPVREWPLVADLEIVQDQPTSFAVGPDAIWIAAGDYGEVLHLDPRGEIVGTVPVREQESYLHLVAVPRGFVAVDGWAVLRRYLDGVGGATLDLGESVDRLAPGVGGFGVFVDGRWQEVGALGRPTGRPGIAGPRGPVEITTVSDGGTQVGYGDDGGWSVTVRPEGPARHAAFADLLGVAVTTRGVSLCFSVLSQRGRVDGLWLVELDTEGRLRTAERFAPRDVHPLLAVGPDGRAWRLDTAPGRVALRRRPI